MNTTEEVDAVALQMCRSAGLDDDTAAALISRVAGAISCGKSRAVGLDIAEAEQSAWCAGIAAGREIERQSAVVAAQASGQERPLIARALADWHEDDGPVAWWAWCGHEWVGEPAWIGTPLDDDWPGYHTHWTKFTTASFWTRPSATLATLRGEG